MINLTDNKYNLKELLDSDKILNRVSDYNIWKFYYPELEVNQLTNSPLRCDKNPSFSIYMSDKYHKLMFKDFANGDRGDVFIFLSKFFNLKYFDVLVKIAVDFNLTDYFYIKDIVPKSVCNPIIYSEEYIKTLIKNSIKIEVKVKDWSDYDYKYWESYGVSKDTLIKYNILPISYIFINDDIIKADRLAFAYVEHKDNVLRFKIYQPYSEKMKWINNLVEGTLSGWKQLDEYGDTLIIASSLKDAMCLHDLGFNNVIAPQTENYIHKEHIINHLKLRFKKIYIFYDNDSAGIKASDKMCELYSLLPLRTDDKALKDPSDYYRAMGGYKLLECINKQIKN